MSTNTTRATMLDSKTEGPVDDAFLAYFAHVYGKHRKLPRCPECHGDISRWGKWYRRSPGWVIFRCTGGHHFAIDHGVVIGLNPNSIIDAGKV